MEQMINFDALSEFAFSTPSDRDQCCGVYPLVDYLTVIFNDCRCSDVFEWLHLYEEIPEFFKTVRPEDRLDPKFIFSYNGIRVEVSRIFFYHEDLDESCFERVLPSIRCEISGSGLNFLRSRGVEMYYHMRKKPLLPEGASYHFTRIDISYDFINYAPTLFDDIANYCLENALPSGRIPIKGLRSGLGADVSLLGKRMVALGSSQSSRRLVFYDKRFEQSDKLTNTYNKPNSYGNPDSWIRMEARFSDNRAHTLVLGVDYNGERATFESVLKDIYHSYQFMSKEINGYDQRKCVDFWQKLFSWEELQRRIILNEKYVESLSPSEKLDAVTPLMSRRCIAYIEKHGLYGFLCMLADYVEGLEYGDELSFRRKIAFQNFIGEIPEVVDSVSKSDKLFGLIIKSGRFSFLIPDCLKDY